MNKKHITHNIALNGGGTKQGNIEALPWTQFFKCYDFLKAWYVAGDYCGKLKLFALETLKSISTNLTKIHAGDSPQNWISP